jgi:hypothetical protein
MGVLKIMNEQFREKQESYPELVDGGTQIVLKRGKKRYMLTSVDDEDLYFTPEMREKIDCSLQQAGEGNVTRIRSKEELLKHLDSL